MARTEQSDRDNVLEFHGVTKRFPGQTAVDNVSFSVRPGETHALVGENGAGKTTLIKILAGEYQADEGETRLDGEPIAFHHPSEAPSGAWIHPPGQCPRAVPVGRREPDARDHRRRAVDLVVEEPAGGRGARRGGTRGRPSDPPSRPQSPSSAAGGRRPHPAPKPRVVVFDEVTAPMTQSEIDQLFELIGTMKSDGVAIVYISHRLHEIFQLADRVTVLKNGAHVTTDEVAQLNEKSLARLIIGKDPEAFFPSEAPRPAWSRSSPSGGFRTRSCRK